MCAAPIAQPDAAGPSSRHFCLARRSVQLQCIGDVLGRQVTSAVARRLNIKTLEFVPYGVVVDGSAERARYARHLQGYLAATLLPVFAAWEGELPEHLQKARQLRWQDLSSVLLLLAGCQIYGE